MSAIPKTVREFSAGGVVLRQLRGEWHVAIIEPNTINADSITRRARQRPTGTVFALPKGAVDHGESLEQSARREVLEETGVLAENVSRLGEIRYTYVRSWGGRERVSKRVVFFLFRYSSGRLGNIQPNMQDEVRRAFWMPLHHAPRRLTYKGERDIARLALRYLKECPEFR